MIVQINGHSYQMDNDSFKKMISQVKKSIPKKPTLIALEKDGFVELRNDVFKTQKDLTSAVVKWNREGYKAKYTRGI